MIKPVLPFVEIMVTQACNISCVGCTNYSDLLHKGYLTWAQGLDEIKPWLTRVTIPDFGIIGGEPLLNPEIRNWISGLRQLMPMTQLRFTTNGLLLAKNLDILDLCYDVGNVVFKVTKHVNNPSLDSIIDKIKSKFSWEPVTEYGIKRWRTTNNLRLQINQPEFFTKSFLGDYENMMPHNNNPIDAFNNCCQQTCPLIYNGKIFKCSTQGLLKDTLEQVGNPNLKQWQSYLHEGISPDCTDTDLDIFLNNFGKPHSMCQMCPTANNAQSKIIHLENVSTKKVKI